MKLALIGNVSSVPDWTLNDVFIFHPALNAEQLSNSIVTPGEKLLLCLTGVIAESLTIWPLRKYSRGRLSFFTNFAGAQFIQDSFRANVAQVPDFVRVFPDRFDNRGKLVMRIGQEKIRFKSPLAVIFRKRHNNSQCLIRLVRCAGHKSGYFLSPCHFTTLAFPMK
jgi:hypothetical protein